MHFLLHHLHWKIVVASVHPLTMNLPLMIRKGHAQYPQQKWQMIHSLKKGNHQTNHFVLEIQKHMTKSLFQLLRKWFIQLWVKVTIFLKDGRHLHLVKVVGAPVHYHKFWDDFLMEIEDGTGWMWVVLPHPQCLECSGAVELRHECTINSYVCVIGMMADDFNIWTIIASDVRRVSSGNEIT